MHSLFYQFISVPTQKSQTDIQSLFSLIKNGLKIKKVKSLKQAENSMMQGNQQKKNIIKVKLVEIKRFFLFMKAVQMCLVQFV